MDSVVAVMEQCLKQGIALSATKAQVGTEVKFAGFLVNLEGTKLDPHTGRNCHDFDQIVAVCSMSILQDLSN